MGDSLLLIPIAANSIFANSRNCTNMDNTLCSCWAKSNLFLLAQQVFHGSTTDYFYFLKMYFGFTFH